MNNLDRARQACRLAERAGAKEARAVVSRTHYATLEYRERKVETLEESTVQGLGLTLYLNGRYSSHRTSDLRPDALERFVLESVAMTAYLTPDDHRYLPEPEYYTGRRDADLDLSDPGYDAVSPEARHQLVQAVEAAALERGGDKIISVTAGYSGSRTQSAMATSNGFEGSEERTSFWYGAEATARDAGDKRPEDYWWEGYRHRSDLGDPAAVGRKVVSLALARVGADKAPTGEYPVLVENRTAGRLLGYFTRALHASALQQKQSFLEGRLGESVMADHLSMLDEPFVVRGLGSRLFDGEGIAARPLPIVENGVLRNFYVDTYYGRKLGMKATTAGASNLVFSSGHVKSPGAWMRELGKGILVTAFLGGNSNSVTGDFSVGISGLLFENGEIVRPVAAMNLAGNHLEFWKKLRGLGDDPFPFSTMLTPTLVFEPMMVAGA